MKLIQKILLTVTVFFGAIAFAGVAAPPANALFEGAQEAACNGANFSSNAAECENGERKGTYTAATNKVEKVIGEIVNLLTIIVGMAAVIMIIINGFKFVTSAGDSNAITSARNGILYAIIGLIIVALAQVIVRFIINKTAA